MNTVNYRDCVLTAVNLGDDTDTVAAVAGGLAGALYGYDSIPKEWLDTLLKRDEIEMLCEKAYGTWNMSETHKTNMDASDQYQNASSKQNCSETNIMQPDCNGDCDQNAEDDTSLKKQ